MIDDIPRKREVLWWYRSALGLAFGLYIAAVVVASPPGDSLWWTLIIAALVVANPFGHSLWWILIAAGFVVSSLAHEARDVREELWRRRSGLPPRRGSGYGWRSWALGIAVGGLMILVFALVFGLEELLTRMFLIPMAAVGAYYAVLWLGGRIAIRMLARSTRPAA